jgi:hypothetical protein
MYRTSFRLLNASTASADGHFAALQCGWRDRRPGGRRCGCVRGRARALRPPSLSTRTAGSDHSVGPGSIGQSERRRVAHSIAIQIELGQCGAGAVDAMEVGLPPLGRTLLCSLGSRQGLGRREAVAQASPREQGRGGAGKQKLTADGGGGSGRRMRAWRGGMANGEGAEAGNPACWGEQGRAEKGRCVRARSRLAGLAELAGRAGQRWAAKRYEAPRRGLRSDTRQQHMVRALRGCRVQPGGQAREAGGFRGGTTGPFKGKGVVGLGKDAQARAQRGPAGPRRRRDG